MANGWILHTPEGFADVLPQECAQKRRVERRVMEIFRRFGYQEAETPTVEYADVFSGEDGLPSGDDLYRFFDRTGRILTLRPDITTPIARMAATKLAEEELPLKLCYLGKGYRFEEVYREVVQREFTQAGVELLGSRGDAADAEVVALTVEALLSASLREFQIDLGQVAFFRGLLGGKIPEDQAESLRQLIDKKDSLALKSAVDGLPLPDAVKEVLCALPRYFGDADMLDELSKAPLPEAAQRALSSLRRVYGLLCEYGYEPYISIDLSMVPALHYYTGIIFKGFARGVGFSICGGGRYDRLVARFGKDLPATGVAIGMDRLLSALAAQGELAGQTPPAALVFAGGGNEKDVYAAAQALRTQGLAVEQVLENVDEEQVLSCARRRGIGKVYCIREAGMADVVDLQQSTQKRLPISELREDVK